MLSREVEGTTDEVTVTLKWDSIGLINKLSTGAVAERSAVALLFVDSISTRNKYLFNLHLVVLGLACFCELITPTRLYLFVIYFFAFETG